MRRPGGWNRVANFRVGTAGLAQRQIEACNGGAGIGIGRVCRGVADVMATAANTGVGTSGLGPNRQRVEGICNVFVVVSIFKQE